MKPNEHDPISEWMILSQARIPITDMEHLVMADIHAIAKKRATQRRYLAFGWLSFLVGAIVGLWIALQFNTALPESSIGLVIQVGIIVALVFGLDDLWRQSRTLRESTA